MITLLHNLGLGDHFICNGLVRETLRTRCEPIRLYCKNRNLPTVQFMYRDEPRIQVCPVEDDAEAESQGVSMDVRAFGPGFDRHFYARAGVGFCERWTSFKVVRDLEAEADLRRRVLGGLKDGRPYVVCSTHTSEGEMPLKWVPNNRNLIYVEPLTPCLFDWVGICEEAEAIHCVDSAFLNLVQSLPTMPPINFHMSRGAHVPTLRAGVKVFT